MPSAPNVAESREDSAGVARLAGIRDRLWLGSAGGSDKSRGSTERSIKAWQQGGAHLPGARRRI